RDQNDEHPIPIPHGQPIRSEPILDRSIQIRLTLDQSTLDQLILGQLILGQLILGQSIRDPPGPTTGRNQESRRRVPNRGGRLAATVTVATKSARRSQTMPAASRLSAGRGAAGSRAGMKLCLVK